MLRYFFACLCKSKCLNLWFAVLAAMSICFLKRGHEKRTALSPLQHLFYLIAKRHLSRPEPLRSSPSNARNEKAPSVMTGLLLGCLERVMGTAPGHQLVYYEHFFRSRHHGMDSIVDSSLRPGQRRPLRVIQSEPSTSINSQSIGFHSEVYPSTGTSRHRPQWAGELRPQRTGSSSTGLASSFTRARNRFMGSEGSPRRRSR